MHPSGIRNEMVCSGCRRLHGLIWFLPLLLRFLVYKRSVPSSVSSCSSSSTVHPYKSASSLSLATRGYASPRSQLPTADCVMSIIFANSVCVSPARFLNLRKFIFSPSFLGGFFFYIIIIYFAFVKRFFCFYLFSCYINFVVYTTPFRGYMGYIVLFMFCLFNGSALCSVLCSVLCSALCSVLCFALCFNMEHKFEKNKKRGRIAPTPGPRSKLSLCTRPGSSNLRLSIPANRQCWSTS